MKIKKAIQKIDVDSPKKRSKEIHKDNKLISKTANI